MTKAEFINNLKVIYTCVIDEIDSHKEVFERERDDMTAFARDNIPPIITGRSLMSSTAQRVQDLLDANCVNPMEVFMDAEVALNSCSHCGALPHQVCKTPKGNVLIPPHNARYTPVKDAV